MKHGMVFSVVLLGSLFTFAQERTTITISFSVEELGSGGTSSASGTVEVIQEITSEYYFLGLPYPDEYTGVIMFTEPAGARVELLRGRYRIFHDELPTARQIRYEDTYEILITLPDGRYWRKTITLRPGMKYLVGIYTAGFTAPAPEPAPTPEPPPPPSTPPVAEEPPAPPCPLMEPAELSALVNQMRSEPFSDDQLSILRTAARDHCFTVDQAIQIAQIFDFDEDRLEALKIIYPKLVDRADVYRLYSVFTFSSTKEEFEEWINSQGY